MAGDPGETSPGDARGRSSRRGPTPTKRRSDTSDPRRSRSRALRILYQADVRGGDPEEVLREIGDDVAARALLDDRDPGAPPATPPEGMVAVDPKSGGESTGAVDPTGSGRDAGRSSARGDDLEVPDIVGEGTAEDRRRARVPQLDGFTRRLVLGVAEHQADIDAAISRFARRWTLSRMPVIDRTVLRLATYELMYEPTPPAVVIDEAVRLAKSHSTDDSGRYVNGVLESVKQELAERGQPSA